MSKDIAIIGAGNSGMLAFNACLEQGLNATVFEMTDQICGQWLYREGVTEWCTSIYKSLTVNSSKEMTAFSNFPPPEEFSNYMSHSKMAQYLRLYAEKIGFTESVKLRHQVINCEPNDDFEDTGKWRLTLKDLDNNNEFIKIFDGVMVCTGQAQIKNIPEFKDQDKFKGKIIHSRDYKERKPFEDKRVVVIGCGISAGDIVVDLFETSSKVYMSARSGAWLTSRLGPGGLPWDYFGLRRAIFNLPDSVLNLFAEYLNNYKTDHKLYGFKPKHRYFDQLPFFTEQLPMKVMTGEVTLKGDIQCFTQNGVIFKGESEETLCDVVILCTGYRRSYPFLEDSVFRKFNFTLNGDHLDLYKNQFFPYLKHQTLCFIGLALSHGSVLPIAELQCRWYSLLISNQIKLPNNKKLLKKAKTRRKYIEKHFPRHYEKFADGHWINTMDSLAKEIGAKPNLFKYFFTDPKLWWSLYFGPCLPYQFRLQGPNKWNGARNAILTARKRLSSPMSSRIHKE